jgi:hypothetical protein
MEYTVIRKCVDDRESFRKTERSFYLLTLSVPTGQECEVKTSSNVVYVNLLSSILAKDFSPVTRKREL